MDFNKISMLQPTEEEIDVCIKDDIKYKTYCSKRISDKVMNNFLLKNL